MTESKDWRLEMSHDDIRGLRFLPKTYVQYSPSWDHEHCEFCFSKFSLTEPDTLTSGYATDDNYYWVCQKCFLDFADAFELR